MKKQPIYPILVALLFSMACQFLFPARSDRDGVIISACPDVVKTVREIQPGRVPQALLETGTKHGGEFDVNDYFMALTHLSMQEGYVLDYVYQVDDLGAYPILYAHPADEPAFGSTKELPANLHTSDFLNHVTVDGTGQGYFELVALATMARQFYLDWHANYNDTEIVCNAGDVDAIVSDISDGSFGAPFDGSQQRQAHAMENIEPLVKLTEDTARVEIVIFTKWGGFYRQTFTINRSFPHTIIDVQEENLVPYDCGIMF